MKSILAAILGISRNVLQFFAEVISNPQVRKAITVLLPIAIEIVRSIDAKNSSSNDQKRLEAVRTLEREALVEGVPVTTSLVNFLVEFAVLYLRSR